MKLIKKFSILFLVAISFAANAQTDKETTARIVEAKDFSFVATSAMPLDAANVDRIMSRMSGYVGSGGTINLTGDQYDLSITPDTVKAFLPFYGRAFTSNFNQDENGYKFTSKDFVYKMAKRKKRGWDINIQTKDVRNNARMTLSIGENGYAMLSVISNDKQSITYNGYIRENKTGNAKTK